MIQISVNNVPIRLTPERWNHITESHCEMAGYFFEVLECIKEPEGVYLGNTGELIALKEIEKSKYLVVIYKELKEDGFVITSFITKKKKQFERRKKVWP